MKLSSSLSGESLGQTALAKIEDLRRRFIERFVTVEADITAVEADVTALGYTAWTTYSPSCSFGGSTSNVVSSGGYMRFGGWIDVIIQFRTTGAVTAGQFAANLPVAVNSADTILGSVAHDITIGQVSLIESGAQWSSLQRAYVANGANGVVQVDVSPTLARDTMRQTAPFTWAADDGGILVLRYRT